MPPSLPTGTVSQTSAGTRTFPPEPASDEERERVSAASTPYRPPTQTPSPPAPSGPCRPSTPSQSPVVPRREHDVAVAREHERVAELARENEALREYIREQATDKQAVIERYEHLLSQRDAHTTSRPATATQPPSETPAADGLLDALRSGLSTLRSRAAGWLSRD